MARLPALRLRHVWFVLPLALTALAFGLLPLRSWDYWWHITAGRWSSWSGEILTQNMFLYTLPTEHASLSQPWFSQSILYHLFEWCGLTGSLLFRNILVCAIVLNVMLVMRKEKVSPVQTSLTLLAALPLMVATMTLRTHLFVWPLFVFLLVLMRWLRRSQADQWWLLLTLPVTLLWAQLHGSFLMPCVLLFMWGVARLTDVKKRWKTSPKPSSLISLGVLAVVCAMLAAALHPAGFVGVYAYLYDVSSDPVVRQTVTEWMPTVPSRQPLVAPLLYLWLIVGAWFFIQRRRVVDRFDLVVFFGFGALAVFQTRGVLWFALAAPLTLTPYLPGAIEDIVDESEVPAALQVIHAMLIVMLGLMAVLPQPGLKTHAVLASLTSATPVRRAQPWRGLVTEDTPLEAMAWLVEHPEHRRLFHDQRWAGLILWSLMERDKPTQMVFVDQRIELPKEQIWGLHDSISMARSAWRLQLEAHDVTAILVDPTTQAPLFKTLEQDTTWTRVTHDDHHSLFVLLPKEEDEDDGDDRVVEAE